MEKSNYVVGLGEILWDCNEGKLTLGGAPANFAYHVNQFGLNAMIVSAIGKDGLGADIEKKLKRAKLQYLLPHVPYKTGKVCVRIAGNGIPAYKILENVAWDNIPSSSEMEDLARHTQAVCFGSLAQRNEMSRSTIYAFLDAMPAGALRVFDINLRQQWYTREIIETSLRKANILKINDDELLIVQRLFGYRDMTQEETCRRMMKDYQLQILILTCGEKGSYVFAGQEMSFLSTPKIKVVDTVGAGDSFTASFIASILLGKTFREAHRIAVDVSAFICTKAGAMHTIPVEKKDY